MGKLLSVFAITSQGYSESGAPDVPWPFVVTKADVSAIRLPGGEERVVTTYDLDRFFGKVDITPGCWLWTASVTRKGYGLFSMEPKKVQVHRFAYQALVGPIPDGLTIDHLCRNVRCVNPLHLEPVTMRENIARAKAHMRPGLRTHCVNGHPYSEMNTRYYKGKPVCRVCDRARPPRRRRSNLDRRR